jgi:hypothetical protein
MAANNYAADAAGAPPGAAASWTGTATVRV